MNELATLLGEALSGSALAALPLALAGGVVTGLNPCCLALYPAAAGTCCAVGRAENPGSLSTALAFVIGLSFATAVLGAGAALAGTVLTGASGWTAYVIAAVPILMGLHVLGWLRLPIPRVVEAEPRAGLVGAFFSGVAIWAVIVPCGTPVLAAMLSYAAFDGSVVYGALLLFAYGFGAGLPVLLLGAVVVGFARRLEASGWRRRVEQVTGGVLVAVGLYLVAVSWGLSRETRRVIRQNLCASLGIVVVLVPAAVLGLMGAAVLVHEGSTLPVVTKALRMLAYREARDARLAPGPAPGRRNAHRHARIRGAGRAASSPPSPKGVTALVRAAASSSCTTTTGSWGYASRRCATRGGTAGLIRRSALRLALEPRTPILSASMKPTHHPEG